MYINSDDFKSFIVKAKIETYAGYGEFSEASRPASHDLHYKSGDLLYIDTYLGGFNFAGEEAVWINSSPIWAMNYYGRMLISEIPEGFSDFLKESLRNVPFDHPYRGPEVYSKGDYKYLCSWKGEISFFSGQETILLKGVPVYELLFHGGSIK